MFLRMLGPNSTALPHVSCFYIHVPLHPLCPNCRMGLSPQLTSLMSLPTDLPTAFTLLAPQEQPGQGLQDRRPGVTCWYRVYYILSSSRSKNAPDIGTLQMSRPTQRACSNTCLWLFLPAFMLVAGKFASSGCSLKLRDESGDSTVMSINQLFPSNLQYLFLGNRSALTPIPKLPLLLPPFPLG